MKFYPYEKGGGAGKVLAMLKGGGEGTKRFSVVLTRVLDVLTILEGWHKRFAPFKRGEGVQSFTLSWGGGSKTVCGTPLQTGEMQSMQCNSYRVFQSNCVYK